MTEDEMAQLMSENEALRGDLQKVTRERDKAIRLSQEMAKVMTDDQLEEVRRRMEEK